MAKLSPIVPDASVVTQPIAPVTVDVSTNPVTDNSGSVVARPGSALGMSEAYAKAAQSGDPAQLLQFAKSARGTEFEEPALNAWRGMANRVATFDDITNAVDKKGGPQTPAGKLETVNQWPKAQNEPSILRGLAEHLMGNPNARLFVSEGLIKPRMIYDRNGKPLQENWTESGVLKNVIDPITGKEVSPQEYGLRGAGITDTTQTLPYIASKDQLKFNQDESNKAQAATNDIAASAGQQAILHSTAAGLSDQLFHSLDNQNLIAPNERRELSSFAARAVQLGGSASQGLNALDQYTRGGGASLSEEQKKYLGATVGALGYGVDAGGNVVDKNGKHVDVSKLKSLQESGAFGRNFEQTFQQTVDQARNSIAYKKMNAQQQQTFDQILDLTKMAEQKKMELAQKHGANANLPFLMSPILSNMTDQYARFQVQQQVGMANADLAKDYADYRAKMMQSYPPGTAPAPGEIEAAYTRTPQYLEKRDVIMKEIRQTMSTIEKTKNTKNVIATSEIGGEAPQTAVNAIKPPSTKIDTSKPSNQNEAVTIPEIQKSNPQGFKVIRENRQFKVKE